jgi:hypothetical protein
METMNVNKFGFTACIDEKANKKLYLYQNIEKILNNKLDLTNYTQNITEIVFVYIALDPEMLFKENDFTKFRRKSKIVEIGINLNYAELLLATEDETLEILAEAYLQGIEKYLLPRKDFNGNQFYNDVKQLFTEHRLLKLQNEILA